MVCIAEVFSPVLFETVRLTEYVPAALNIYIGLGELALLPGAKPFTPFAGDIVHFQVAGKLID